MANEEITIFVPAISPTSGGAEHIVIRLIAGFLNKDIKVTLVMASLQGDPHKGLPSEVKVINLNCRRTSYSILKFTKYIKQNKPKIILSHLHRANRIALLAKILSRTDAKLHIVEHNTVSAELESLPLIQKLIAKLTYKLLYPHADTIIHVSKAAAVDLQRHLPANAKKVITIYNPVVNGEEFNSNSKIPHEWFKEKDIPVILGIGRFSEQKDFLNLIEAFYIVRKNINSRLIVLGKGEQESKIVKAIQNYGISDYVHLPGYVDNPFDYMRHASVFVLSSKWEALPTVLVEALACGCPVVSTDCPSGPFEILEGGKYGTLVPTNDSLALGNAILESISNNNVNCDMLRQRARDFSIESSVNQYLEILD